ncbi:hypothetical protein [Jannaschia sp. R86511]|uniref:hypothetical protein n=1 Tax=Jannaschia sp. R86511 TaxID=3093853 RepID=UPI0036D3DB87
MTSPSYRPAPSVTQVPDAVRARSAVESAQSVDVVWDGGSCAVVEGLAALADGGLAWDVPDGTALHRRLASSLRADDDLGVCVGVTDLAPLAVPGRVRGRLALAGWLAVAPGGGASAGLRVRLDPVEVVWHGGAGPAVTLDEEEYRGSAPDPLAAWEADLLLAVDHDRPLADRLERLALAGPGGGGGGTARLLWLDRAGLVVRVLDGGRDGRAASPVRDVRLRLGHDATTVELAWEGLEGLAQHVRRGPGLPPT